jgi:tripartite ATP-independent transporter DctP family solute receptor
MAVQLASVGFREAQTMQHVTTRGRRLRCAAIGAFAALAVLGAAAGPAAAETELVMRIGITTAADSILGQAADHFGKLVDINTNGRIEVKLFPNGLLGKENTELEGMVAGTHDAFIHISSYTGLIKEQRFWDLPFLFPDGDAVARVTEGPLRPEMEAHFRKYGLELLGFFGFGYRQFTGNVRPYNSPEDLRGIKHRIPGGKSKMILFKALGADPSTVSFPELYQALKAGVVDSQDNPLSIIYNSKFHEVTKYLSICNYIYNPVIFAVGQPFWKKVPDWAKPIIKQAARDTEGWSTMLSEKIDVEIMQKIMAERPDYQVNHCPPESLAKWQAAAKPVYDSFIEDAGQEWADKVFAVAGGKYEPGYDPTKR